MTFKQLVTLAARHGITVERTGRRIDWWWNHDHSIIAECHSVEEAAGEVVAAIEGGRQP